MAPRAHHFSYRVFMMYLALDELSDLFDNQPFWSTKRTALARFKREDFLGDPNEPLDEAVRNHVEQRLGERPSGPIYLLANLRYFGFIMNPIACYYCFAEDGETLEYIVAEVNNTPWDERHSYVLHVPTGEKWLRTTFPKAFHVSPFHPMDMDYHWHSNKPGEKLCLGLANFQGQKKVFDAHLSLQHHTISQGYLNRLLWRYPLMTMKVGLAIYWQALRLWLKKTPLYSHPTSTVS